MRSRSIRCQPQGAAAGERGGRVRDRDSPVVATRGGFTYEAGPTGFGLYRAAVAAAIEMQVLAPGKTPRASADRVKTDRKDSEPLCRLLLAGQLTSITVRSPEAEAATELYARTRSGAI
jgi:transposase